LSRPSTPATQLFVGHKVIEILLEIKTGMI